MTGSRRPGRWNVPLPRLLAVALLGYIGFFLPTLVAIDGAASMPTRMAIGLALGVILFLVFIRGTHEDFGLGSVGARRLLAWGLGVGIALQIVLVVASRVVGGDWLPGADANVTFGAQTGLLATTLDPIGEPIPVQPPTPGTFTEILAVALGSAVLGPIVEKVFFRGLIYRAVRDSIARRWAPVLAIVVTALGQAYLFVVAHPADGLQVAIIGLMAVAYALVFEATGSLVVPMVAHSIFNSISFLIVLVGPHRPADFSPAAVLVFLAAPVVTWGIARLLRYLPFATRSVEVPLRAR